MITSSNGNRLIKNPRRPYNPSARHDPWLTHAQGFASWHIDTCASGALTYSLGWTLVGGAQFIYLEIPPTFEPAFSTALSAIYAVDDGQFPWNWTGERYNYFERNICSAKFTPAQFAAYLLAN